MSISVVIPAHPARIANGMLQRAIDSVKAQTRQPDELIVIVDYLGKGAGWCRQVGLRGATSKRVAFLDSDDEFLPPHLEKLEKVMEADNDCIMAYSWFEAVSGPDPFEGAGHFGKPFDPRLPHHTTVTTMVDWETALYVGGFPTAGEGASPQCSNEDWIFLLRMAALAADEGLHITHLPERTWRYHIHSNNTSGKHGQGDAR